MCSGGCLIPLPKPASEGRRVATLWGAPPVPSCGLSGVCFGVVLGFPLPSPPSPFEQTPPAAPLCPRSPMHTLSHFGVGVRDSGHALTSVPPLAACTPAGFCGRSYNKQEAVCSPTRPGSRLLLQTVHEDGVPRPGHAPRHAGTRLGVEARGPAFGLGRLPASPASVSLWWGRRRLRRGETRGWPWSSWWFPRRWRPQPKNPLPEGFGVPPGPASCIS